MTTTPQTLVPCKPWWGDLVEVPDGGNRWLVHVVTDIGEDGQVLVARGMSQRWVPVENVRTPTAEVVARFG